MSVILSAVSWRTQDRRILFDRLDLSFGAERTGLIGRNGVGKSTLLKLISGAWPLQGGHIAVAGTLGVLDQHPSGTLAEMFGAREALAALRRAEAGKADADDLAAADWTLESRMASALARCGLHVAPDANVAMLSGGQRVRAALAALIFRAPDMLLLDEPTNHLDREGRQAVYDLLDTWRKGAIVVSHDRDLLERMDAIVELNALGAQRYGGGWSVYEARRAQDLAAAHRDLDAAEKHLDATARQAQIARERQARRDGAGKHKAARGDMPNILLGARRSRSEDTGAAQARRAQRQKLEAENAFVKARERLEIVQPFAIAPISTGLSQHRLAAQLNRVSAGYGGRAILSDISLQISGPERVAITGANGSGKSTLLAVLAGRLQALSGDVSVSVSTALLDQHTDLLRPGDSIRDNFHRLHPELDENACRAALARFMFRADAALQYVAALSGGQRLRAALACVLGGAKPPQLLLLDEPSNHLDLDALQAVEAGLNAYDGALVVVSHDERFLDAIGVTRCIALSG
jgi:ATPase subunit of ABC transporter with duplicated ATPase domains